MISNQTSPWLVITAKIYHERWVDCAINWGLFSKKKDMFKENTYACVNWRRANTLKWYLNIVVNHPSQVMYFITKPATSSHGFDKEFWSYPRPFLTTLSPAHKNNSGNSRREFLHQNQLCPCWGNPLTSAITSFVTGISIPLTREQFSFKLSVNSIVIPSSNPYNLLK